MLQEHTLKMNVEFANPQESIEVFLSLLSTLQQQLK